MQKEEIKKKISFLLKYHSKNLTQYETQLISQIKETFDSTIPTLESYVTKSGTFIDQVILRAQGREVFLGEEEEARPKRKEPEEDEEIKVLRKRAPICVDDDETEAMTYDSESSNQDIDTKIKQTIDRHGFCMTQHDMLAREVILNNMARELMMESKHSCNRLKKMIERAALRRVGLLFSFRCMVLISDEERGIMNQVLPLCDSKLETFVDMYLHKAIEYKKASPLSNIHWFTISALADQLSAYIIKTGFQAQELAAFKQAHRPRARPVEFATRYQQSIRPPCRYFYPHFFRYLIVEVNAGRFNF